MVDVKREYPQLGHTLLDRGPLFKVQYSNIMQGLER